MQKVAMNHFWQLITGRHRAAKQFSSQKQSLPPSGFPTDDKAHKNLWLCANGVRIVRGKYCWKHSWSTDLTYTQHRVDSTGGQMRFADTSASAVKSGHVTWGPSAWCIVFPIIFKSYSDLLCTAAVGHPPPPPGSNADQLYVFHPTGGLRWHLW